MLALIRPSSRWRRLPLAAKKPQRVSPNLFVPVSTRAAFEDVARQVVELIEKGQLREGDMLPGERVLAAKMEVSRPTIRLAVSNLVKDGVLTVTPGPGGGILVQSRWLPQEDSSSNVELEAEEIFELLGARRVIEPRVALLAATRGSSAHYQAMRDALELQEEHLDDRFKAFQAELHFHRLLWQAASNHQLERTLVHLFRLMSTALDTALRTPADKSDAVVLNRELLDAVERGHLQAVEVAMDRHLSYLERTVEESFGRKRIRATPQFLVAGGAHSPSETA
jgi:GntR family transcriptional regulator, transcriptional repressor for pyruvate dehydrogenase complex